MHLKIFPLATSTKAELSISYKKPKLFFTKIISFLFADWYCKWCLKKMLDDAKEKLMYEVALFS